MNNLLKKNTNKYQTKIENGIDCIKKNELIEAKKLFSEAIVLNKSRHEGYINLANLYLLNKDFSSSTKILFNYLNKNKFNSLIANYLGDICLKYKLKNDILKLFKFSNLNKFETHREKNYLYYLKGCFFEEDLNFKLAIKSFNHSIKCDPNHINSYLKLFNLFESTNDIKNLDITLKQAFKNIEIQNHKILFYYKSIYLFRTKKYSLSNEVISNQNLIDYFHNDKEKLIRIFDLQSKNNERLCDYNNSFKKIVARNQIIKSLEETKKFNKRTINEIFDKYKKFYTKTNISLICKNEKFKDYNRLVFLVGFPRSGTTLLDSILRTHSKITVLEEQPYLLNERHNFFINNNNNLNALLNITNEQKSTIRNNYLENINFYNSNNIFIDKFPLSIIEIGFIRCIFPDAKIILALRHPCDVVLSCFFSLFKTNDAMINFLDWEDTIDFYNNVFDLFYYLERELNFDFYKIKYENVVNDFKFNISGLLKYIGLKYEEKLINFNSTAKKRSKIFTPSYSQVINPLYKTSIGRWKNFKDIKNSEENLKQWIEKFEY